MLLTKLSWLTEFLYILCIKRWSFETASYQAWIVQGLYKSGLGYFRGGFKHG